MDAALTLSDDAYAEAIARRRAFRIEGYATLADVGFDGEWVTPLQQAAGSPTGPVMVALHWLDVPSVHKYRSKLTEFGYGPNFNFNQVIDRALALRGLVRSDVYMTQAFHLLPRKERSQTIPSRHLDHSFDAVTRHEIAARPVIALGVAAAAVCARAKVPCVAALHPSARGLNFDARAARIAEALKAAIGG